MANKTNGAFANRISEKLIHYNTNKKTDKQFANVSIPYAESLNGYATTPVSMGQVLDAKNQDGSIATGVKNIYLGEADKTRDLSVLVKEATKRKPAEYKTVTLTNKEIADLVKADKAAYRKAQKEAKAQAEAPAEA
jgi:hypothetical protein